MSFKNFRKRIGDSFKRKSKNRENSFSNDGTSTSISFNSISRLEDMRLQDEYGYGVSEKRSKTRVKNNQLDGNETAVKTDSFLVVNVNERGNLPSEISEIKKESPCVSNLNGIGTDFEYKYGDNNSILSQTYANDSNPRGLVFMQNFEIFDENVVPTRNGSDKDYKNLLSLFTYMGYECNEQNGTCKSGRITAKEFYDNLTRFKDLDEHKHVASCFVVIMSHGCGDKKFNSSDGKEIRVKEICQALNNVHCKHLTDKPKILIFQFCRTPTVFYGEGGDYEKKSQNKTEINDRKLSTLSFASYGGSMSSVGQTNGSGRTLSMISNNSSVFMDPRYENSTNELPKFYSNPSTENIFFRFSQTNGQEYDLDSSSISQDNRRLQVNSDFFLVFSTVGGEVSYRDPKSGAVLIRAICEVFKKHAHQDDIEELFKKVSLYLKNFSVPNETETLCTQTCERTNIGFDKKFYLIPKRRS